MDVAGHALYNVNLLYARAGNSTTSSDKTTDKPRPAIYKVVGIILAVCSGLFIGVSFVLKKKGLLRANAKYNEEAGEGYGYLKNAFWWTGMTLMIVGEICNFVAYAFVDAILVTPLGALSVVVTTILSAIFLKERLSFVGKVGCFNCIIGSVVIVINAPEQSSAATIQEMKHYVLAPGFLSYAGVVIVGSIFTALWAGPRYGKKSMMVYLTICSMVGGLSVVATQGLGAAIVTQISGTPQFNQWFLYVLLVFVVATLLTEIIYLNKALNIFNAALVTPTYYVYFTSATIVTSAILFRGFHGTAASISTVVMGFLVICSGVVLLQLAKSSKDVPDTAVFKGDLDQVRTMAEQEEPESEPRADTIRGGGALLRALSKRRTERQADEVRTLHSEAMEPIGEDEVVEWDGIRRRKTVLGPGSQRSLSRTKTIHPPLGMSRFPNDDNVSEAGSDQSERGEHVYGLPAGLRVPGSGAGEEDTAYHGSGGERPAIHWTQSVDERDKERERAGSRGSSLVPPRPPPHGHGSAKRAFSFQNVFHRQRSDASESSATNNNNQQALGWNSSDRCAATSTEEERLGLVKGDSNLPGSSLDLGSRENERGAYGGIPEYYPEDDDWQITSGRSESPENISARNYARGGRTRGTRDDYDSDDLFGEPRRQSGHL
ncbi:hypothetical protein H2203_005409 [Taxawa tesnikishii (nom. ined.)]|nr:hypothetical protein H2203_005409 [Dothideales sp. JES 119]